MFNVYGTFQFLISVDFCCVKNQHFRFVGGQRSDNLIICCFVFLIRIPVSFHHAKSSLSGRKSSVYHEEGDHGRHLGRHHPAVVGSSSVLSLHTFFPLHSDAVDILHLHHVLETAASIFSFCRVSKTQCV